ncbi:glycosyltransferase family 2 protein [Shewanella baltica]|uniref:glycosyltransferase family 2 protein n=1 Tax=Shewanella baltica TaxID=62322 RepID=UPI0039AF3943
MLATKCIDIVLASYNGAEFIEEQLASIINCNGYSHLIGRVIITDDFSSDKTKEIVSKFKDNKIQVFDNKLMKGPVGNFAYGLSISTAPFVMFADQDDVWFEDKILKFYEKAKLLDSNAPGVVYSDLILVDENLNSLGCTFFENEKIPFDWGRNVSNLYFQNVAPGCAMLLNRKCIDRIVPINSDKVMMHDWWALIFSSMYSNVFVINEPLVKYRQHSNNAVGASVSNGWGGFFIKAKKSWVNFHRAIVQLQHFYSQLSPEEIALMDDSAVKRLSFFNDYYKASFFQRSQSATELSVYKSGLLRDLITRFFIIVG